jgi:transposase-like protein
MTTHRKFTSTFKAQVVLEVLSGSKTQADLAREHQIKPDLISRWRRQFLDNAVSLFEHQGVDDAACARIAELERALGRKTMELEIAKKASSISGRLHDVS